MSAKHHYYNVSPKSNSLTECQVCYNQLISLGISRLRFCNLSITYGSHWLPIQRFHLVRRLTPLIGMLSDLQWYYAAVIRVADPFVVWDLLRQLLMFWSSSRHFSPVINIILVFFLSSDVTDENPSTKKELPVLYKKVTCKIFSQKTKLNANFFPETKVIIQKQKVICNN